MAMWPARVTASRPSTPACREAISWALSPASASTSSESEAPRAGAAPIGGCPVAQRPDLPRPAVVGVLVPAEGVSGDPVGIGGHFLDGQDGTDAAVKGGQHRHPCSAAPCPGRPMPGPVEARAEPCG